MFPFPETQFLTCFTGSVPSPRCLKKTGTEKGESGRKMNRDLPVACDSLGDDRFRQISIFQLRRRVHSSTLVRGQLKKLFGTERGLEWVTSGR